jgi:hypothetical protein
MTAEIQRDQNLLSEHLLLLRQLNYWDPYTNYQDRLLHSTRDTRGPETQRNVHLLDTIAVALATGSPGDVYAAAFDKDGGLRLVLAKNDSPTREDRAAATELVCLIQNPKTNDQGDLFPFLIKRCGENINRRIEALAASINKTLREDLDKALKTYKPNADVQTEFHNGALLGYGDEIPPFPVI